MRQQDAERIESVTAVRLRRGVVAVAIGWLLIVDSGCCSQLRLPAIDPTGQFLFAPKPTSTTLALPGSAGEGCGCLNCLRSLPSQLSGVCTCLRSPCTCLRGQSGQLDGHCASLHAHCARLKEHFSNLCQGDKPAFTFPEPVFVEPAPPPPCLDADPRGAGGVCHGGTSAEPCVPSAVCDNGCLTGPRAVLIGSEIDGKHRHGLPDRGKRGCILLTPQRVVAPVGGEVVLLSGICGADGYLQTGEPLEWMLTPESVGTFIEVGDDEPGLLHRWAGIKRAEKQDPSFARGVTSLKKTLITRGNLDPRDDVALEKGQTWITLSSPSEGTSRVTVLAPESECWDQRKATTTIYWIDARWDFPPPQREPAGTPVSLTTRVTKAEGTFPARGWRVRYELLNPELARFANTDGLSVVEVDVDEAGNATAGLLPIPGTSGTATIEITVIRPGGETDRIPTLPIGRGQTIVTWSSPQLGLRAGAPNVASPGVPFEVVANVENPGDQPAADVFVEVTLPDGVELVQTDQFAQQIGRVVRWEIGTIPARQFLELHLQLASTETLQLAFVARGAGNLLAEDVVRVNIYPRSLAVSVRPERDRYQAGDQMTFNIAVQNVGTRPLANVQLEATGDDSLVHYETGLRVVRNDKEDGPLQPGQTWNTAVDYIAQDAGRRCLNVQATADVGQQATAQACVTVINPPPVTPAMTTTLQIREQLSSVRVATGDVFIAEARVINSGQVPLRNVEATMTFPPEAQPLGATMPVDQSRVGQFLLRWNIPEIAVGSVVVLEGQFRATTVTPRSQLIFSARSEEGASGSNDFLVEVVPGQTAAPATPPPLTPNLPPVQPPPRIPGGQAPPTENPPLGEGAPAPVAPALPQRSGRLQLSLLLRDNPARVDQPIGYSLTVTNDSDQFDGAVSVRFQLPQGVSVDRVAATMNPNAAVPQIFGDTILLEEIGSMRPGESIRYEIVLKSNQAQRFNFAVSAVSQLVPQGVSETVLTDVVP